MAQGVAAGGDPLGGRDLLDLVCGPASPLPETYQRYRLVAHLGSGGQAEVYRAVRLCGGVTSAPMTVKVFRIDPRRPLVDELRSWDKGDAALMDLNNRGVTGICRRADGFYGPPPHRPGQRPASGGAVPYQVYDYLHGINLRDYVARRAGLAPAAPAPRAGLAPALNGLAALRTLVGILRALHHPQQTGASPVLHMDVKPSNVMVLANGEVRLIDFTGARYWREEEITQIAYTPESGGPEAFGGASQLSPAYDVHGFGAVAYYLVTGEYPREGRTGSSVSPRSALRRHPTLEGLPELRNHLHGPLADRPADRPSTLELPTWTDRLGELVRRYGAADIGVEWAEPGSDTSRAVGRARPPVAGTETDAFQRIEKLERELVELREAVNGTAAAESAPISAPPISAPPVSAPPVSAPPVSAPPAGVPAFSIPPVAGPMLGPPPVPSPSEPTAVESPVFEPTAVDAAARPAATRAAGATAATRAAAGGTAPAGGTAATKLAMVGSPSTSPNPPAAPAQIRGRASVPPPRPARVDPTGVMVEEDAPPPWRIGLREDPQALKRGSEFTVVGAFFAFICWGVWAAAARGRLTVPLISFALVLAVAAGVFMMTRLLGRLILVQRMGRSRHTAKGAHALTGLFLVVSGVAYLRQTQWILDFYTWLSDQITG
jgi:serine/threonine protein kinase